MPQMPSFSANKAATDVHRQIARNNFQDALSEIEHSGINGLPVEGNPLRELREQIWPAWHDAMHPKADNTKTRQYVGSKIEERHRAVAAVADQIDRWARTCHLVERDERGKLRPAGWVVKFADECCDSWSKEALGISTSQPWWSRPSLTSSHPDDGSNTGKTVSLPFHLDDVSQRQGESRKDFCRRFLRAARARFEQIADDLSRPALLEGGGSGRRKKATETKSDPLDHHRWLVLYQCCGWPQSRIGPSFQRTQQAVSAGLRSSAKAVGLVVRERAVTNKKPKTRPKLLPKER